ncbi:MAG TPA: ribulose-phosphate 3-epimerase [Thermoplasmatales archaeon]|nr:ribulose-phosphate 3-epimerase [Thermoplasmatales archaeon]
MVLVAPSILSADFSKLGEEIKAVEMAGADWIHIDVMDGHFVPNLTIGPVVVKSIRKTTSLPFDVHLMISNPEKYIERFVDAGADILTVHIETVENPLEIINKIRDLGCKAGLTLNPDTPFKRISEFVSEVDLVLIMTVYPGFSGQKFKEEMIPKISEARKKIDSIRKDIYLEVDGGINDKTSILAKNAGADVLVAGNHVFKSKNYEKAISLLKKY